VTLELRHLSKAYTPKVVPVKNLTLSVDQGEFLTLLGPSGCGKSTVLRMIAGLEQPSSGQIFLNGQDVTRKAAGDRNVAMVFQSYALYPHWNVYDNIASGLKLRKTPAHEIKQRVNEVADFLGLHDLMQRKPSQLSGGQRQRVAVARTLVRRPEVFLLDEPLSNLDALLRENVRAELKQLFAAQSAPVVYVTHDQVEAMTLSTKVAVLNHGDLQQLDAPYRIYSHPANLFVAGFVGSPQMNVLPVPCEGRFAIAGTSRMALPDKLVTVPEKIVLGIRPEHVRLATPSDSQTMAGQIVLVENLGMNTLISVRVESGNQNPITVRLLLPADQPTGGDRLTLALPAEHIHWFDAETHDRIPGD
jgi:multiple sugar transport system ATP-binding protein